MNPKMLFHIYYVIYRCMRITFVVLFASVTMFNIHKNSFAIFCDQRSDVDCAFRLGAVCNERM